MKTTIYWAIQYRRQAAHEIRFRAQCWCLSQQVELLAWRRRLDAALAPVQSAPLPVSEGQGGRYAVYALGGES